MLYYDFKFQIRCAWAFDLVVNFRAWICAFEFVVNWDFDLLAFLNQLCSISFLWICCARESAVLLKVLNQLAFLWFWIKCFSSLLYICKVCFSKHSLIFVSCAFQRSTVYRFCFCAFQNTVYKLCFWVCWFSCAMILNGVCEWVVLLEFVVNWACESVVLWFWMSCAIWDCWKLGFCIHCAFELVL